MATNKMEAPLFGGKDVDDVDHLERIMNCIERSAIQ